MSLKTPEKIRQFQRKLYVKAKEETASQGALARHPAIHRYVYLRRAWSSTTPAAAHRRATDSQHMNPVGESDAGKPHVRFDERRPETEPWSRIRHPQTAKAAGNSYFLLLQPPRRSSTLPGFRRRHKRSPGGTKECSPGRKPGLTNPNNHKPRRGDRNHAIARSLCRPYGAVHKRPRVPGLAPWATIFCPYGACRAAIH